MRGNRLFWRTGLVLASAWLLGAAPSMAAPTAEDRCASRMAEASGRYLDCAMRENGRAARRGRAVNLDRCERKLGRHVSRALARWSSAVCPSVNQVGGEATTLGDQLNGLVSEMSEAVGVSDEGLSRAGAKCAAQKAKVLGQDLRCRAEALARGAYWDRAPNEEACSERRLARKLARIEKKYGGACPTRGDAGTLAARGQQALSEVTDWVAPSMQRHAGVTDPLPLQNLPDADGDGVPDNVEIGFTLTDPSHPDTDRDGRSDMVEFFHEHTNPLKFDLSPTTVFEGRMSERNISRNGRASAGALAKVLGMPDTPIGFALSGISVYCAFEACISGYTGEKTRAKIDVLSNQLTTEFTALGTQLSEINTQLTNLGTKILTNFETQACRTAVDQIPDLSQASCSGDDDNSVLCLYFRQKRAVNHAEGQNAVRPFFDKFGIDANGEFRLKTDLLTHIKNGDRNSAFKGYAETLKTVQDECSELLRDKQLIYPDNYILGGDLIYQRLMATFLAGGIQSYRSAIGFLSTFRSAQAWYWATPELRKDAFWLAMQNQSTAAIPLHASPSGAKKCRYSRKSCTGDEDCVSVWDTCQREYDSYDPQIGCTNAGEVMVGTVESGKCVSLRSPDDEAIWTAKPDEDGFDHPATVTMQGMQAMNHICQAWALHQPQSCAKRWSGSTTGFYCQQLLCEPKGGDVYLPELDHVWQVGRDYIHTLLNVGAPFSNSDYVYEPTRDVMWLKNPGWGTDVGLATTLFVGELGSRFFSSSTGVSGMPKGDWPSAYNEKKKVLLTPATKAHWMGGGSAMIQPNTDGMAASAVAGERKCSRTNTNCYTEADCPNTPGTPRQTCGTRVQSQLRAGFSPSLLLAMSNKAGLVWRTSQHQKSGHCTNTEQTCSSDYDCAYTGSGTCGEFFNGICAGGPVDGAECVADWQCRVLDPSCSSPDPLVKDKTGESCTCENLPSHSPSTSYALGAGRLANLACAAGWSADHLLFMGDSFHGTYVKGTLPSGGTTFVSAPLFETLGDSWGFKDRGHSDAAENLGSCRTKMDDLMPYPYVREFTRVGGRLSRDYGLAGLSGGQSVDCNSDLDFSDVNIHDLIHGSNMGLNNTADMVGDSHSIFEGSVDACKKSSPVGMFGAWPNHPTWPATSSPTHGYNVGMNFGLSCNWLDSEGKFSRCADRHWDGRECAGRKRSRVANSLNIKSGAACHRENERPFVKYTYTTTTGNACANLKGDVECKMFDGLKDYMEGSDYCLYPIKERKGSTDFYPNKAFPIACGSASEGCTSNHGASAKRNWINFRQCLSFSDAPNCAHLGVQTPYLRSVLGLHDGYKIYPLVTPGGVASSTEMVAAYAVNAFSRGFGCGEATIFGKTAEEGPAIARGNTALDSTFLTIQAKLNAASASPRPVLAMWPVIDLFEAGKTGALEPPAHASQDIRDRWNKACSTSLTSCVTDGHCPNQERCVDVGGERDGYAMVCPGAAPWGRGGTKWKESDPVYSYQEAVAHIHTVADCMKQVSGSEGLDRPNHDPGSMAAPVCQTLFKGSDIWDDPGHVEKVVETCRGPKEASYLCNEHCMWALKCVDAYNSAGATPATRLANIRKVAALHKQNFDAQSRDPSSCCSDALCESQLEASLAPAIPAVSASYQPPNPTGLTDPGQGATCYSRDEARIHKVDGLQSCFSECLDCRGGSGTCDINCAFVHYNATWCTMFPDCAVQIPDPYGGTLYTRADVEAWHQESIAAAHTGLLGDETRIPPGAMFGNRMCENLGFDSANEKFVAIHGLSLSECADACQKQNYWQPRSECSVTRDWCKTTADCGVGAGTCRPVHSISTAQSFTWEKYTPQECGSFGFYGGEWDHLSCSGNDCEQSEDVGATTTCMLYPKGNWEPDDPECSGGSSKTAPQGWAVWPVPKEVTWSADQLDCTNPGGDPRGRTCSRAVPENYARLFLDQGLSEANKRNVAHPQEPHVWKSVQGMECTSTAECDTTQGLTCSNGRCVGSAPGYAGGPCEVHTKCFKDKGECVLRITSDDPEQEESWPSGCSENDQCVPYSGCNPGLKCSYADSSYSDFSGFWARHAWRPGGVCVPDPHPHPHPTSTEHVHPHPDPHYSTTDCTSTDPVTDCKCPKVGGDAVCRAHPHARAGTYCNISHPSDTHGYCHNP